MNNKPLSALQVLAHRFILIALPVVMFFHAEVAVTESCSRLEVTVTDTTRDDPNVILYFFTVLLLASLVVVMEIDTPYHVTLLDKSGVTTVEFLNISERPKSGL